MDAHEFKQRFLPHHRVLYRVAFHLTGCVEDAEDLVQDLYLHLWTKRNQLDEARQTQAYLVTALHHLHVSRVRLVRPERLSLDTIDTPTDEETPERRFQSSEASASIRQLIDSLPPQERRVIRLLVEQDMGYPEMEQTTGLSKNHLRVIISRTRQRLKQQLDTIYTSWKK